MSDYDLQTGEFVVDNDGRSVELSQVLLYVIELNDEMARVSGIDLMSATGLALDSATAVSMVRHLGLTGRAYIKEVGGKAYLILKGYPGQRPVLTGTRYLASNPKVVNMVISPAAVGRGAARMTSIAVVAYASLRVVEFVLSDSDARFAELVGPLYTDIVKFGMAAGAGYLAALAVGTVTTIAAGPLIAAILVGAGASILLDRVDRNLGITESLVRSIDSLIKDTPNPARIIARETHRWERWMINRAINSMMRRR
ncbi:MAG: hypothetical protein AB1Z98_16290 [Nannocystaceae bacterium]